MEPVACKTVNHLVIEHETERFLCSPRRRYPLCAHVSGDHRRWPGVLQWYQRQSILGPSLPTQLALARRRPHGPLPSSEIHTSSVHILLPDRSDPPATTSARRRRDGIHSQRHLRVGERRRRQIGIRIGGGSRRGAATRPLGVYIFGSTTRLGDYINLFGSAA